MPVDKPSSHREHIKVRFATSLLSIVLLFFSAACTANLSNTKAVDKEVVSGADRDEHDCIASAGYSWSQLREECVRLWEAGIELTNAQNTTAGTVGYLITNNESRSIELFLPEINGSVLLHENARNWVDSKKLYSLSRSGDGLYRLHNTKGILLYQSGKS